MGARQADQQVTRDELVAHVAARLRRRAAAQRRQRAVLPRRSRRCRRDRGAARRGRRRRLLDRGLRPRGDAIDDVDVAAERVAAAAEAAHGLAEPLVLTARAENHIRGVDDLDDTIARLIAYRDAGADVVYAPGLRPRADRGRGRGSRHAVNVLALPDGPRSPSSPRVGVRRVSTGSLLAAPRTARWSPGEELLDPGDVAVRGARRLAADRCERLRLGFAPMAEPTIDDIDALVGPATPALRLPAARPRPRADRDLPADHPVRRYGEEQIELLDRLGHASSLAEDGAARAARADRLGDGSRRRRPPTTRSRRGGG